MFTIENMDKQQTNSPLEGSFRRERARDTQRISDQCRTLLAKISTEAQSQSRPARLRRLTAAYLNSKAARLWAAQRALDYEASDRSILRLAALVNPFFPVRSGINWWEKRKTSGNGTRYLCDLPPLLKANHYLIKDVLEAQFRPCNHIYDITGKGRDKAALAVKEAIEAGYEWCFIGDVRDCYQHVAATTLATQLPLPRLVVENSLDTNNLVLRRRSHATDTGSLYASLGGGWNGPQGLLQGSPASSIILATLFASMADKIAPHDCLLLVISDNLFIAAKSAAQLDVTISLICDFLREHPAGPFNLKNDSRKVPRGNSFEFLGYGFGFAEEGILIEPSHTGWERILGRIEAALQSDIDRGDRRTTAIEEEIRNSFSGYNAWVDREQWREDIIENARQTVTHFGYPENPTYMPDGC